MFPLFGPMHRRPLPGRFYGGRTARRDNASSSVPACTAHPGIHHPHIPWRMRPARLQGTIPWARATGYFAGAGLPTHSALASSQTTASAGLRLPPNPAARPLGVGHQRLYLDEAALAEPFHAKRTKMAGRLLGSEWWRLRLAQWTLRVGLRAIADAANHAGWGQPATARRADAPRIKTRTCTIVSAAGS